jgi:hypothetical protein
MYALFVLYVHVYYVNCNANNYDPRASVTTLLQVLNWPTLQHRRQLAKLIMMYRITYHLIEIPYIGYDGRGQWSLS